MLTVCFVLYFLHSFGLYSQIWMMLDLSLCGLHFWPVVSNDLVSFFSVSPLHFFVSWIVIHIGLVLYLSIALSNLHLLFFLLVWYGQLDAVI